MTPFNRLYHGLGSGKQTDDILMTGVYCLLRFWSDSITDGEYSNVQGNLNLNSPRTPFSPRRQNCARFAEPNLLP